MISTNCCLSLKGMKCLTPSLLTRNRNNLTQIRNYGGRKRIYMKDSTYFENIAKLDQDIPLFTPIYKKSDMAFMEKQPGLFKAQTLFLKRVLGEGGYKIIAYIFGFSLVSSLLVTMYKNNADIMRSVYWSESKAEEEELKSKEEWLSRTNKILDKQEDKFKKLFGAFYKSIDETYQWDSVLETHMSPLNVQKTFKYFTQLLHQTDEKSTLGLEGKDDSWLTRLREFSETSEWISKLSSWSWRQFSKSDWSRLKPREKDMDATDGELVDSMWLNRKGQKNKIYCVTCRDKPNKLLQDLHGKSRTCLIVCGDENRMTFHRWALTFCRATGMSLPFALGLKGRDIKLDPEIIDLESDTCEPLNFDWKEATFESMNFFLKMLHHVNVSAKRTSFSRAAAVNPLEGKDQDHKYSPTIIVDFTPKPGDHYHPSNEAERSEVIFVIYKFLQTAVKRKEANAVILVPPNSPLEKLISLDDNVVMLDYCLSQEASEGSLIPQTH